MHPEPQQDNDRRRWQGRPWPGQPQRGEEQTCHVKNEELWSGRKSCPPAAVSRCARGWKGSLGNSRSAGHRATRGEAIPESRMCSSAGFFQFNQTDGRGQSISTESACGVHSRQGSHAQTCSPGEAEPHRHTFTHASQTRLTAPVRAPVLGSKQEGAVALLAGPVSQL